jgi:hypothetical protein
LRVGQVRNTVAISADFAQQLENVRAMERRGALPTPEKLQAEFAAD